MAENITIRVFGDDHFSHYIRRVALRATSAEPIMHVIGSDLIDIVEHQFDTEGARGGRKWRELQFDTITRRGSAHPILIDSGDMFDALITPGNLKVTDSSVELELPASELQKAESAQYGFTAPDGRRVAPRKIINLTKIDRDHFRNKIGRWLVHGEL